VWKVPGVAVGGVMAVWRATAWSLVMVIPTAYGSGSLPMVVAVFLCVYPYCHLVARWSVRREARRRG
jgi:hypothetical protein